MKAEDPQDCVTRALYLRGLPTLSERSARLAALRRPKTPAEEAVISREIAELKPLIRAAREAALGPLDSGPPTPG